MDAGDSTSHLSAVSILLEACLDSVPLARAAEAAGAKRIELCDRLDIGGTTPTAELIRAVAAAVRIPIFAIVRPRGGDFVYSASELDTMKRDAAVLAGLGASGMVVGILNANGTIDAARTREVMAAGNGLPTTFHLAFESVPDQREALETLVEIGVERVLTKGGGATAVDGVDGLRSLVNQAAGRIAIMAGGGVRENNVGEVVSRGGVREIHTRGLAVAEILRRAKAASSPVASR